MPVSQIQENADMRIVSPRWRWIAAVLLFCGIVGGCNSLKDSWSSRGLPQQWEPENGGQEGDSSH